MCLVDADSVHILGKSIGSTATKQPSKRDRGTDLTAMKQNKTKQPKKKKKKKKKKNTRSEYSASIKKKKILFLLLFAGYQLNTRKEFEGFERKAVVK
jgi:hypothetical protein